jgi:long-chain acyl-CoA synthetase
MWLPLSHVFGKTLISGQIATGHVMAVDGRVDRIIHNLPAIRPTLMASAPRIFEKVYNGIAGKARAEGGAKYKIFMWAAKVAREYARVTQANRIATGRDSAPAALRLQHALADKLVYTKIRAAFGGRLRGAVSGSAALAPEIGYFFKGAGVPVLEGYGLTETSAGSTVNRAEDFRVGTVGLPLPGTECRVVDPDEPTRDVAPGAEGELVVRGPQVFGGYWKKPDETEAVFVDDPDGGARWFRTGDIVAIDDEGFVRIVDRIKELIITGGFNVAPSEVEEAVRQHPSVADVAVVGLPDDHSGEQVVAVVVLKPGEKLDEAGIREAARAVLTPYKVPKRVLAVDELPRSLIGKVIRREVRTRLINAEAGQG